MGYRHVTSVSHLTPRQWRELSPRFCDLTYRQTWSYGVTAAERVGANAEFVAFGRADNPTGLACVRVKSLPLLPVGLAFVDWGPLCRDGEALDAGRFRACLQALVDEYVSRRSLLLRIKPPLVNDADRQVQLDALADLGFRSREGHSNQTIIVDLRPELTTLRERLHPKWRNHLSRAERSPLQVAQVDSLDWSGFRNLFDGMVQRKGFAVSQGPEFFCKVQERSEGFERLVLHVALDNGTITAGHLGAYCGDTAISLLGATNARARELRASYLLQWAAIGCARMRGLVRYDIGGIDPVANPDGYNFKKRMGGVEVAEIGPFERSPMTLGAMLVRGAEAVRRLRVAGRGSRS